MRNSRSIGGLDPQPRGSGVSARALVARLGPHPATRLGLDLDDGGQEDLGRWLVASIVLGGRVAEPVALAACQHLATAGLATPARIAGCDARALAQLLEEASLPKSESTAGLLVRVCRALQQRRDGSIEALAAGADDLEDLARRLSQLGSGFGRAAVLRFLTPLRTRWSAAGDLPATPAVCAAARDLGFLSETHDEQAAPAGLARWLSRHEGGAGANDGDPGRAGPLPAVRDLEAALARLGRAACLRGRVARCPLGSECPGRAAPNPAGNEEELA